MCCICLFLFSERPYIFKVIIITVFGLSFSPWKMSENVVLRTNRAPAFVGLTASRTRHTTYVSIPTSWVLLFGAFFEQHFDTKRCKQDLQSNHRWRVVRPRGKWYPHNKNLGIGSLAAAPRTLRASSNSSHTAP